jgi:transcriptional regulator GlxA family with amidase domain
VTEADLALSVEFLTGDDMLEGPAAAMVDVLRMVNALAQLRGQLAPPLAWQWRRPDGRAPRRPGTPARRARRPQVAVVPGWQARSGAHLSQLVQRDGAACARLRAVHAAGGHVVALHTGVALLGEAGLLDDRAAVAPWPFIPRVMRHAPRARLADDAAWIETDRVWTADSPTLATELLLQVLARCGLRDLADAGRAVVLHTPARQHLASAIAQHSLAETGPGTLERARRWLDEHWQLPYSAAATASAAGTSERSLLRHFQLAFGQTPLQHVHQLRVTHAQILLETSYLPIEAIAERCGWHDLASLRKVFQRLTGLTPAAYRERHRLRTRRRQWGQDIGQAPRA